MTFGFYAGICNIFAVPFAITMEEAANNDGFNSVSLHVGPFVIGFEWEAA